MQKLKLKVDNMSCAACVHNVHKAVLSCSGVSSVKVNLFDHSANIEFDNNSNDNWEKYVILLCWMCTSPHPFLRGCIMRKLVKTFDDNPSMTFCVLEKFHNRRKIS